MINRFSPSIVIVDIDTNTPGHEILKVAAALQRQVVEHFSPAWGVTATVRGSSRQPSEEEIELRLLKQPTLDGALGFHDQKPNGTPIAYVFTDLCREAGTSWSSCASHEILELLGDPYLRLCVQLDNGEIWDRENCDRVEADVYEIDGVEVSNFNYPEAFEPPTDRVNVRYDHLGLSKAPNEVRPGGYAQKYDPSKGWTQVGEMRAYRKALAEHGLSRGHKRAKRNNS